MNSLSARTVTFMSRNRQLHLTEAPASSRQLIQLRTPVSLCFGDLQWQPHPFEKQCSKQHRLHLILKLSWGPVEQGTRAWTTETTWSPSNETRKKKTHDVANRGIPRFCHLGCRLSGTCLQTLPNWVAPQTAPIQLIVCTLELGQESCRVPFQLCDNVVRHFFFF